MKQTPMNQPYFCKACQLPASGCECGESQTPKLKPCPFCGKPAILKIEDDHHGEFFELGCPDKECVGNWAFYTELIENLDASVKAWNTRAESELLTAANEMEEALKRARVAIESAPHRSICHVAIATKLNGSPGEAKCTCWKAAALHDLAAAETDK